MTGRTGERPPGPSGRWLVGNGYDYDRDRIGFLKHCQSEYGDVFSFSPSTVVVCDPQLVNALFKESNDTFLAEEPLFANGRDERRLVAGIDGWMQSRGAAWRGTTRSVIRSHGRRIVAMFEETLKPLVGQDFEAAPQMRHYSARLGADFCFGRGSDDIAEVAVRRSALAIEFMKSNLSFPRWLPLPSVRRTLRAGDQLMERIAVRVRQRRAQPPEHAEGLLDVMLADDAVLTDEAIVRVLSATMLASVASPGSAMAWLMLEIARNPDDRRRLREEAAASIAETGGVTDDRRLPYTQAFVREVLRLHPPTWLMGRVVRRPYVLGGWPLATGTRVMFSPYLVHRDPRWWPDPDDFQPGRWHGTSRTPFPHTYFPFGAGPRLCIGMHLGVYQLVTGAAYLAANYDVVLRSPTLPTRSPDAVLVPHGFRASVAPVAMPAGSTRIPASAG
jgi:enediyne biosynthesis protein E7